MTIYRRIDHMTWPAPGEALDELEWRLCHSFTQISDELQAASVISAYRALIALPSKRRQALIAHLRLGPNLP